MKALAVGQCCCHSVSQIPFLSLRHRMPSGMVLELSTFWQCNSGAYNNGDGQNDKQCYEVGYRL